MLTTSFAATSKHKTKSGIWFLAASGGIPRHRSMASFPPAFLPTISSVPHRPQRRQRPCAQFACVPRLTQRRHATAFFSVSPNSLHPITERRTLGKRIRIFASSSQPGPPSSSGELDPRLRSDLTNSNGFALGEAQNYTFEAFELDESAFQVGGAYAISDASNTVMYMGYTKNIATKLSFHQRLQPQSCITFRVYVPPVPPELMSPEMLESVLEYWVLENGGVPKGNTIDRALWEQEKPLDRQFSSSSSSPSTASNKDDIPQRDRTTSRRPSAYSKSEAKYYSSDPFTDAYRSSTPNSSSSAYRRPSGWEATDDDYVQVDADPFDPFSASTREKSTTRSSWTDGEDDATREEWYPIFLIMGFAGIVWIFGLLSNALPAATPSLGM